MGIIKYTENESDVEDMAQELLKHDVDVFWGESENVFLYAIVSFLTQRLETYDRPYAQISAITGNNIYYAIDENVLILATMATQNWDKDCNIELFSGVKYTDAIELSQLAVIFENLRHFEAKNQGCNIEEIKKPYCLQMWDTFNLASKKTGLNVIINIITKLNAIKL